MTAWEVKVWGESSSDRGAESVFKIEISVTGLYIICVAKNIKSPNSSVISDTCINALPEWFGGGKKKMGEGGGESEFYNWVSMEPGIRTQNWVINEMENLVESETQ